MGPGWSRQREAQRRPAGSDVSDPVPSHLQMRCCGVTDYTDWYPVLGENTVPDRCCMENSQGCGRNTTTPLWRTVSLEAASPGPPPRSWYGGQCGKRTPAGEGRLGQEGTGLTEGGVGDAQDRSQKAGGQWEGWACSRECPRVEVEWGSEAMQWEPVGGPLGGEGRGLLKS